MCFSFMILAPRVLVICLISSENVLCVQGLGTCSYALSDRSVPPMSTLPAHCRHTAVTVFFCAAGPDLEPGVAAIEVCTQV